MLEGKIQIDLHNHNSGFTERYEQKNMITNATKYMLGNVINMKQNLWNLFTPIATYGLGGIFLFDGALEEDVENIHFPSNVHLVGHAGQTQDVTHPMRGSIDLLESGPTDTGYVNVWDFSTSQANGTIASLALTNRQGGDYPFEHATVTNLMPNTFQAAPITYDAQKRELYYRKEKNIYKTRIPDERIYVYDPYYGFTKSDADELVCTIEMSAGSYTNWEVCNGYDGYMYVAYFRSNSSGDATIRVRRYRISDYSFNAEPEQVITLKNICIYDSSGSNYPYSFIATRGYYYIRGRDSHCMFIVEIGNETNIKKVDFGAAYFNTTYMRGNYNGGIAITLYEPTETSWQYTTVFVYPDGKYVNNHTYRNIYGGHMLETEHLTGFHYYTQSSYRVELIMTPWYLGSICNLSSPVLKTHSTDMKVTYTLTDI